MRIGRRETKRRLTGLTFPTVLGTGGGGATWNIEVGDQSLARSVLQYLEDRRVLYDPIEAEVPRYCRESVQEIRVRLASFIADSHSPELRNPLRAIQAACRQFLTDAPALDRPPSRNYMPRNYMEDQWVFNQALGEFRARAGTCIAVIIESFDVDVDEHLAQIMPPQVDEEHQLE